jgi:hypothetical protein
MPEDEGRNADSKPSQEDSVTKDIDVFRFTRSEEFVEVYANYVSAATSPWDMIIMFSRTVVDDPQNPMIEQRASISLSPQTAKALLHILSRNLQTYDLHFA